jgi:hypothetical protein
MRIHTSPPSESPNPAGTPRLESLSPPSLVSVQASSESRQTLPSRTVSSEEGDRQVERATATLLLKLVRTTEVERRAGIKIYLESLVPLARITSLPSPKRTSRSMSLRSSSSLTRIRAPLPPIPTNPLECPFPALIPHPDPFPSSHNYNLARFPLPLKVIHLSPAFLPRLHRYLPSARSSMEPKTTPTRPSLLHPTSVLVRERSPARRRPSRNSEPKCATLRSTRQAGSVRLRQQQDLRQRRRRLLMVEVS